MVKTYLRYVKDSCFGVIASGNSNSVYNEEGTHIITPSLEDTKVWNIRTGLETACWHDVDNKAEVTSILRSPNKDDYAVGYSDGSIRIWRYSTNSLIITFNGHKSAVTALAFNNTGSYLASGSKDTDLIVWDVISEQGLYRLKGHKDQITGLKFLNLNGANHLLSVSKDTLLKLWDLTTQHCIETLIGHRSEIWGLDVNKDETLIVTGALDQELKFWDIDTETLVSGLDKLEMDAETESLKKAIKYRGSIARASKERVSTLKFHPSGRFLGCQGADRNIELFKVQSEEEIKKKIARRKRRQREKNKKSKGGKTEEKSVAEENEKSTFADEIVPLTLIKASSKVKSFDFKTTLNKDGSFNIMAALSNNSIEIYTSGLQSTEQPTVQNAVIDLHGHRSDIRTLALSSDDEMLLSGSNNSIKIWNIHTKQCIRTLDSGYALCSAFVPGNKHVIVGTKTGQLEIYDISSSSLIESIDAHDGAIWSLQIRPDKKGFVTGSADKDVKFWDFQLVEDEKTGVRRLSAIHMRTLRMSDDVLCVRYSQNQKLIAISLLDSTVKVFYHDTLKFFLSLYGHKLPVLSMDISSDNTLIATASADKSIKLWGLDFGDCHKSIFAHQDSIMQCQFVWGTHYLFTVSKDKLVKYWDCDKFENIQKLEGHHSEVWALAVGKYGNFVVTGSHDRSIRIWTRTEEPLFLEEERDKEYEQMYNENALNDEDRNNLPIGSGVENENGEKIETETQEVASAGKKTMETLKAGETILEAIEIYEDEKGKMEEYEQLKKITPGGNVPRPARNPYILALHIPDITPEEYVLREIKSIKSSELEEALLVLPFSKVTMLFESIAFWIEKELEIKLACRILFFLLKVHQNQLTATKTMMVTLNRIKTATKKNIQKQKNIIGFNLEALKQLKEEYDLERSAEFFDTEEPEETVTKKRKHIVVSQ
jgi:U3 small nucleolar RNA-associated protein 12